MQHIYSDYGDGDGFGASGASPGLQHVTVAAPDDEHLRPSDVGKLARRFRRRVVGVARADDRPTFARLLADHLAVPLEGLEVVEESWPSYDLVNVQTGLDTWLAQEGRDHELLGLASYRHREFGLTDLLQPVPGYDHGPTPGNVAWSQLASGPDGQVLRAVRAGLYLVTEGDIRSAVLVLAADPESGMGMAQLHVVSSRPGEAAAAAAQVRHLAVEHNVFRGQVISFGRGMFDRGGALQFHPRPAVSSQDVILPSDTLAAITRQVVGVAEHRDRLLAARQHLKRGLLLYGPPGVGKTHSVRYLTSQLPDVTILLLSGDSLQFISTACSVARLLQPAMIVVEDVDLIAEDRGMHPGQHPLLFMLLNEMDGLAEDADVVFLLTTNRADILEPALAARPGRVDQAVSLDLPDAAARRQLFSLYRAGLEVDETRLDDVIEKTEGVTASFLKELLRRAALLAAAGTAEGALVVSADQLDAALDDLLDTRNAMTRVLLGGGAAQD